MITIAGGIILAVFFFAALPYLILLAGWLFALIITLGVAGLILLFVWGMIQEPPAALAGVLVACGLFVIWMVLKARSKARIENAQSCSFDNDDEDAKFQRRFPYFAAELDRQKQIKDRRSQKKR